MRQKSSNSNTQLKRKRFAVWDGIIIAALLCASAAIAAAQNGSSEEGLEVVVKKDSAVVYTAVLSQSAGKEVVVDEEYHILLNVMSDGVRVESSECGDQVCVNTGKITRAGQAIVCLPAHIVVELKGGDEEPEADVLVG